MKLQLHFLLFTLALFPATIKAQYPQSYTDKVNGCITCLTCAQADTVYELVQTFLEEQQAAEQKRIADSIIVEQKFEFIKNSRLQAMADRDTAEAFLKSEIGVVKRLQVDSAALEAKLTTANNGGSIFKKIGKSIRNAVIEGVVVAAAGLTIYLVATKKSIKIE